MSRSTKRWMKAAACLIALGLILFVGVMFAYGWDFSKLSMLQLESKTYTVIEDFYDISLHCDTEDILFVPSEDGKCTVVCATDDDVKHDISVTNGKLSILTVDDRAWYEFFDFSFRSPKITVYLPQNAYGALTAITDTGDISIPDVFSFESIDAHTDTGDITCAGSASEAVTLRTDTGDITVKHMNAGAMSITVSTGDVEVRNTTCTEDFSVQSSTGDVELSHIRCQTLHASGDTCDIELEDVLAVETLTVKAETGDIELEACDANELFLEADTGDISGTLLTEKVFLVKTDTGEIDVPNSITGGRCEIRTDTGDIEMHIAN